MKRYMGVGVAMLVLACGSNETILDEEPRPDLVEEVLTCIPAEGNPDADLFCHMEWDGRTRLVLLTLPDESAQPYPLVLNFHGFSHNPSLQNRYSELPAATRAAGVLLATPAGTGVKVTTGEGLGAWNAGNCCAGGDDVGFVSALIDVLVETRAVDPDRVFAAGMSNGGFFSYRLACDLADKITAITSVAGADMTADCEPVEKVSILEIHGTADHYVPYDGGRATGTDALLFAVRFPSVADTVSLWTTRNVCSERTEIVFDNGDVTCERHPDCADGATVEWCTVADGGHTWPGASFPSMYGPTNHDLSANEYMLTFFLGQP